MSQQLILSILQALGGQATQRQIEAAAKPHFPTYSNLALNKQVNRLLNKLRKWGDVTHDYRRRVWIVKAK